MHNYWWYLNMGEDIEMKEEQPVSQEEIDKLTFEGSLKLVWHCPLG